MSEELDKEQNIDYTNQDVPEKSESIEDEIRQSLTAEPAVDSSIPEHTEEQSSVEEVPEEDPKRKEALAKGWNPSGELPYTEWLGRESFFKRIHKLNKKTEQLEGTILDLKALLYEQNKDKYDQDQQYLENVRDTSDEASEVREASKRLVDLETKQQQLDKYRTPDPATNIPSETLEFINRHNDWFTGTGARAESIKKYAVAREAELQQENPSMDLDQVYEKLESEIEGIFLADTQGKKKSTVAKKTTVAPEPKAPSGAGTSTKGTNSVLFSKLDDFDKKMHQRLVKTKQIPESEFFKSIAHKYS